jgi:L-ascorbate metabolism protein UlaG (beta-lactamase superfamily)
VEAIGQLDAVMIPVGGFYTIDAEDAKAICEALKPRIVIPMHYRHDGHGLAVVAGVEPFLALWDKEAVHREESNTIAITPEKSGVWVPTYHIPE